MSSTSQKILLVEDSPADARRIATELRLLGLEVTVISGIHEALAEGRFAPCSEYGVAAMHAHFYSHQPLRLSDFALVLLDGAIDGEINKGWELLQAAAAYEPLPPVIGISNCKGSNDRLCTAGAVRGHHKSETDKIVEAVAELIGLCVFAK